MVTLRFFAAARAAVGAGTIEVDPGSLAEVLGRFDTPVLSRCSYLINGVAVTDASHQLVEGDLVDVLPPFAGG
jgi:molybdopterin synthase sulfur carrier subunit